MLDNSKVSRDWYIYPAIAIIAISAFFFLCEDHYSGLLVFSLGVGGVFYWGYRNNWIDKIIEWTRKKNTWLKWISSIYPGLATCFLIFFKDRIFDSTSLGAAYIKHCWHIPYSGQRIDLHAYSYNVDYLVSVYLISVIIWPCIYISFVQNETLSNRENINENQRNLGEIKSAILRVPNPKIFAEYNYRFKEIIGDFNDLSFAIRNSEATLQTYNECIGNVLLNVCDLTAKYVQDESAIYGANIMLYIQNTKDNQAFIETTKVGKGWLHLSLGSDDYQGILHTVEHLIIKDHKVEYVGGTPTRAVPAITLPILKHVVLPGACRAAALGESIIDDVTDVDLNYKGCANDEVIEKLKIEARSFFADSAKEVKSFISIVIPRCGIPDEIEDLPEEVKKMPKIIGVLNIDCSKKFVLGEEKDYHKTYYCLVKPIISHFSLYLEKYLEMYLASKGEVLKTT